MGFLCLCDSVSKKRHKATTPNGVPQGERRGTFLRKRYFIMFVQEHATPFLRLCNLGSKGRHKMCYVQLRSSVKGARHGLLVFV